MQFGLNGDTPVAADYDGDGKDDIAIYRSSTDTWWVNKSSGGVFSFTYPDQISGEKVVTGDFTGDGKAEFGLSIGTGAFGFVRSEDYFTRFGYGVGNSGDIPAPGDFDGDGIMDGAMYQPATGTWRIRLSSTGTIVTTNYGISTDKPVPSAFVPN